MNRYNQSTSNHFPSLSRFSWPSLSLPSFSVGGIHPPIHDPLAGKAIPIEYIKTPAKVEIPLLQHIGPVAKPLVGIGEHVQAMQLIAQYDEQSFLHSRIHTPIQGIITAIENRSLANGLKAQNIIIEHKEKEPEEKTLNAPEWRGKGYKEILERIAAAGIVGMGGATFPTDIKLRLPINRRCDYLLINAAECEPYLHSDASLLEEMALDVIGGIDVLTEALRPKYIFIGLESNKSYLLPKLKKAIAQYRKSCSEALAPIRIALLKTQYPQGAERQLVEAISGRKVPPGKLPLEVGCIILNVATSKAIYDAVEKGFPLTQRIVTISGGAVKQPKVFCAPLGTPLTELLALCGGLKKPVARMMAGGPMMGTSFYDLQQFVSKGSGAFLFLTEEEVSHKKERPCIHCNACIHACPMGLEPTAMFKAIQAGDLERATGLLNCIECGACTYICPSQIPLTQGFRMGKAHKRARNQ